MTNRELQFIMTLRDEFSATWARAVTNAEVSLKKMQAQLGAVKGWIAGAFTVGAINKMEEEFLASEKVIGALRASLERLGEGRRLAEFDQMANDLQKVTTFGDETIKTVQQITLDITRDANATKQLTPLILDLATSMNISAEEAAKMVAKTEDGQKALRRLGIDIGKTGTESERLAKLTQELQARFGGAAEAAAKTADGLRKIRENKMSDLMEDFGKIVHEGLEPFREMLFVVIDLLKAAPAPIKAMVLAVGALTAAFWALDLSMAGIPLIIGGIVTAGAGLIAWANSTSFSIENVTNEIQDLQAEVQRFTDINALATQYDTLSKKTSLTTSEHAQLAHAIKEIASSIPEAVTQYNDEGEAIALNTGEVRKAIAARTELLKLQQEQILQEKASEQLIEQARKLQAASAAVANYRTAIVELHNSNRETVAGITRANQEYNAARAALQALIPLLGGVVSNVKDFNQVAPLLARLGLSANLINFLRTKWSELTASILNTATGVKTLGDEVQNQAGSIGALRDKLTEMEKLANSLTFGTPRWKELQLAIRSTRQQLEQYEAQAALVGRDITPTVLQPRGLDSLFKNIPKAPEIPSTLAPLDTGSINAQNRIIAAKREELNAALTQADRDRIAAELALEEDKLARMTQSSAAYLANQRAMWAEQHAIAAAAINAIGNGVQTMWGEFVVGSRQAKDEWDAVWLSMRNTLLNAIGTMIANQAEYYLINQTMRTADVASHATAETAKTAATEGGAIARVASAVWEGISKAATWVWETGTYVASETAKTAVSAVQSGIRIATTVAEGAAKIGVWIAEQAAFIAKEIAMTTVFLAQQAIRVAAALAEVAANIAKAVAQAIAALGPFALFAAGGIIAAGVAVVGAIKKAFGFERGGEFKKGERGFIEGTGDEIIAPKRTFIQVMREDITPLIIKTVREMRILSEPSTAHVIVDVTGVLRNFTPPTSTEMEGLKIIRDQTDTLRTVIERQNVVVDVTGMLRNFTPPTEPSQRPVSGVTFAAQAAASPAGTQYDFRRLEEKLDRVIATLTERIASLEKTLQQKELNVTLEGTLDGQTFLERNLPNYNIRQAAKRIT